MNMIGTCYTSLYFAHDQDQCPVVSRGGGDGSCSWHVGPLRMRDQCLAGRGAYVGCLEFDS